MGNYTRLEVLQILIMAYPALILGCKKSNDVFEDDRVCVHVFNSEIDFPEPLLEQYEKIPERSGNFFNIGIPELIICTTSVSFLSIFQYFWPISRNEFKKIDGISSFISKTSEIRSREDIEETVSQIELKKNSTDSALIFTYNDYTKYFCSDLIGFWQDRKIEEFVLFKDPTIYPYLCDFPSLQKGFKRQP